MRCSKDTHGHQQENDVDDEDTNAGEYQGSDGKMRVIDPSSPGDPQHMCSHTGHTETEHDPCHVELVVPLTVGLEDELVRDRTTKEEEDEHSADRDVCTGRGTAPRASDNGRKVWRL